jgi:hypothetical protein
VKRSVPVYIETGAKRVFAGAIDWPGWCRGGRSEAEALEALLAYASRYVPVARRAKVPFSAPTKPEQLDVVERLKGSSGTDFGVASAAPKVDNAPLDDAELKRQTALLVACWETFDKAATAAKRATLSVGPRGGGRSRAKIIEHVMGAEEAYLGQLGAKLPPEARGPDPDGLRTAMLDALTARAHDQPVAVPRNTKRPWSPRYAVRRSAWHALDHAWEIEDRSDGKRQR